MVIMIGMENTRWSEVSNLQRETFLKQSTHRKQVKYNRTQQNQGNTIGGSRLSPVAFSLEQI